MEEEPTHILKAQMLKCMVGIQTGQEAVGEKGGANSVSTEVFSSSEQTAT